MRLNMDFRVVGQEGSMQRHNFTKDLTQDLADASGTGASEFNILKLSPGSVIVDMLAPPKAAQEIQRQSLDPTSRLRNGKVTRFTDTIRLPTGEQLSPGKEKEKKRMLHLDVVAKHPSPVITRQKNGNVPECSHCHSPTPVTYLKCGGCR